MPDRVFAVIATPVGWVISRDEEISQPYETADAALEAAQAEAAALLEQGLEASVTLDRVGHQTVTFDQHAGETKILHEGEPTVWTA